MEVVLILKNLPQGFDVPSIRAVNPWLTTRRGRKEGIRYVSDSPGIYSPLFYFSGMLFINMSNQFGLMIWNKLWGTCVVWFKEMRIYMRIWAMLTEVVVLFLRSAEFCFLLVSSGMEIWWRIFYISLNNWRIVVLPYGRGEGFLYLLVVVLTVNFECYLENFRNMKLTREVDVSVFC